MTIEEKFKKINGLQKKLIKLFPGEEWNTAFLEQVKVDFTYNSNKIEGNNITYGQTIQLLKEFVTPKNASAGDCLDIINHKKVLDIVFDEYQAAEITEGNIKKLHKELMKNPDQWSDSIHYDPGKYKIFGNVTVRASGKIHAYKEPEEVTPAMAQLIRITNKQLRESKTDDINSHPLTIANDFHYKFLNQIHPFGDGNGRIARIFMNLILLKNDFPPIFIMNVDKAAYMNCFAEEEKNPGIMLDFMADRLVESLRTKLAYLKQISKD